MARAGDSHMCNVSVTPHVFIVIFFIVTPIVLIGGFEHLLQPLTLEAPLSKDDSVPRNQSFSSLLQEQK